MTQRTARIPPQDIEAERATLGAMLLEGEAAGLVIEKLMPADFYRIGHRRIFKALCEVCDSGQNPDELVLREHLEKQNLIEEIGGGDYLHDLATCVPSAANIEQYAVIVKEKAELRRFLTACHAAIRDVDQTHDPKGALERSQARMFKLGTTQKKDSVSTLTEIMQDAFMEIVERRGSPKAVTGMATGFPKLDEITCGLQKQDSIILAARPTIGKSSLALSIINNMLLEDPARRVLLFSLEMSNKIIAYRLISMRSEVPFKKLRTGFSSEKEWKRIDDCMTGLNASPLYLDRSGGILLTQLHQKARRMKELHGIELVVIDYIQLMTGPKAQNREREVALISKGLKEMAAELDLPVLFLAQLKRPGENSSKKDKRPKLDDLRESGALEQDADIVLLLHRDTLADSSLSSKASLYVAKHRNGETGEVRLDFHGPMMEYVESKPEKSKAEEVAEEVQSSLPLGDR